MFSTRLNAGLTFELHFTSSSELPITTRLCSVTQTYYQSRTFRVTQKQRDPRHELSDKTCRTEHSHKEATCPPNKFQCLTFFLFRTKQFTLCQVVNHKLCKIGM